MKSARSLFALPAGRVAKWVVLASILVPALTLDIGDRIWWPSRLASGPDPDPRAGDPSPASDAASRVTPS